MSKKSGGVLKVVLIILGVSAVLWIAGIIGVIYFFSGFSNEISEEELDRLEISFVGDYFEVGEPVPVYFDSHDVECS